MPVFSYTPYDLQAASWARRVFSFQPQRLLTCNLQGSTLSTFSWGLLTRMLEVPLFDDIARIPIRRNVLSMFQRLLA